MPKDVPIETAFEKAERLFTPSLSGSLMESLRGDDLPEVDGPEHLMVLVLKMPASYTHFLGRLASGSSFKSAALALGLSPQKMMRWLQEGSTDLGDDIDSYCSRLLLDVQRASALAVGDAEERVHRTNPSAWLARGPAKDFHQGRYWKEFEQQALEGEQDMENPVEPLAVREAGEAEEEQGQELEQNLEDAMKVLEHHQILQDPNFISQAREQFRIQKDE